MRRRLVREQPSLPVDHVIVAVADHPSDPRGLWPADFDLAGRLRTLTRIDVVMTDDTHDAGFRERLERELPGIDERRVEHPGTAARLVIPDGDPDRRVFVSRDREEELRQVTRAVRARTAATDTRPHGADRRRLLSTPAVPVPGATGPHGCAGAVSGLRCAAAGGRAVRRVTRSRVDRRPDWRHARERRRSAALRDDWPRRRRTDARRRRRRRA